MGKLTFMELAHRVLAEEKKPLSPAEIWKIATAKGYDLMLGTKGKTPAQTLYSVVFLDERDNPATTFIKVGVRPARYSLKTLSEQKGLKELEKQINDTEVLEQRPKEFKEKDLHAFLCYFARRQFSAFSKTIRHNVSSRKEFGEWVNPDIIGVYYPVQDWSVEVLELSKAISNVGVKVYSFELKRQLSFLNIREAFFQAVSNSSWAHEGYLVAAEIDTNEDFRGELRRLSASFRIGIIGLDIDDPDASEVLIPASGRDVMDWEALNKLAINEDVRELFKRIKNDLQTNEIGKSFYDALLDREKLIESIRK